MNYLLSFLLIVLLPLTGAPLTEPSPDDQNGPFEVKSGVIEFVYKDESGKEIRQETVHFDNFGKLVKLEENFMGKKQTMIFNKETNRGFRYFEGARKAYKSGQTPQISGFIVSPDLSYGYSEEGSDYVAATECQIFRKNENADAPLEKATYWVYKGIIMKSRVLLGSYESKTATHFDEIELEKEVFAAPAEMSVPYDIF